MENKVYVNKTDSNQAILYSEIDSEEDKNKYFTTESKNFILTEHSASTFIDGYKNTSVNRKNIIPIIDILKRKFLNMMDNENINVGYTSMTESALKDLVNSDLYIAKDLLNYLLHDSLENPVRLQKLIEVMSNLDYEKLYPTNTVLAMSVINHVDIRVQEAAVAAFEKWDDPENIRVLKSTRYTVKWIEEYAKEVIDYLKGC